MHKSSAELKRLARGTLYGKFAVPMTAILAILAVSFLGQLPFGSNMTTVASWPSVLIHYCSLFLILILVSPMKIGAHKIHLRMGREQKVTYIEVFDCYRHHTDRYLIAGALILLIKAVGMIPMFLAFVLLLFYSSYTALFAALLCILISIFLIFYLSITYSLFYFLLLDQDDWSVMKCLRQSAIYMKGNRKRRLYLEFSFLGWGFMYLFTIGIGILWIQPYYLQTQAAFYQDILLRTSTDLFQE
ncbi:MAG: DUF975 family protein [Lachnospiraceae bacterium]